MTLFALSRYWQGFVDHWSNTFSKQSGFTMIIIGCGVVGVLIILAGRKKLDH
jgi:threonine dehydrogenase-like Zn-dependent dehydrogenase